jgi:hypothetical protein
MTTEETIPTLKSKQACESSFPMHKIITRIPRLNTQSAEEKDRVSLKAGVKYRILVEFCKRFRVLTQRPYTTHFEFESINPNAPR